MPACPQTWRQPSGPPHAEGSRRIAPARTPGTPTGDGPACVAPVVLLLRAGLGITGDHVGLQGCPLVNSPTQIAQWLAEIRGQCWIESGIRVASVHYQWDEQINKIFAITNNFRKPLPDRVSAILAFWASEKAG